MSGFGFRIGGLGLQVYLGVPRSRGWFGRQPPWRWRWVAMVPPIVILEDNQWTVLETGAFVRDEEDDSNNGDGVVPAEWRVR